MNNSNKLQAKDLVNVGIYSAIYLVITCVLSFLSLIPIFHPLLAVICPIAGGIPFMLFLTKSKKFGMITMGMLLCSNYVMYRFHMKVWLRLDSWITFPCQFPVVK